MSDIPAWLNSVKTYFLVGEADKRPPDDKSERGQEQGCATAEVLGKERGEDHADAGTSVQDASDQTDLRAARGVQNVSQDLTGAGVPAESDAKSETAERNCFYGTDTHTHKRIVNLMFISRYFLRTRRTAVNQDMSRIIPKYTDRRKTSDVSSSLTQILCRNVVADANNISCKLQPHKKNGDIIPDF